jgi:hypothetical protein
MAHIWLRSSAEAWTQAALAEQEYLLAADSVQPRDAASTRDAAAPVLRRFGSNPRESAWALIAPPGTDVRVSSHPVRAGICILADRDSIRLSGAAPAYFSTEELARVEPFPHVEEPHYCPRCKLEIVAGGATVRCPACGVWHHEDAAAERRCWTYAARCALCEQPTALDVGYRWTPESL